MVLRVPAVTLALAVCVAILAGCSDELANARTLEKQGDLEGALTVYSRVLQVEPDNVDALDGSVYCLLALQRFDEALVVQERLVQLDPSNAEIRAELGFNYLNHQGRPGDAERVFGEAVRLDPSAKHLCFLAQAQEAAGDASGAELGLRQAIATEPGYARSYELLAALLQRQGRTGEADEVIQSAASLGIDVTQTS